MLRIEVPAAELFDESTLEFISVKKQTLQLEHSLVSLSKWESKWCKPFLTKNEKSPEETLDYIKCMTLTQNVDPNVYRSLTKANMKAINDYIDALMTATTFSDNSGSKKSTSINGEQVTSELVYYWMFSLGIPLECQKWHLNRLITLIKIFNIKNEPGKKMSNNEILRNNAALNAARRKKFNSKG